METAYPERLVAEYSYDALGRRVSKTLADKIVSYAYDGQKIAEETESDLSGTVLRTSGFAYGAGGDDDVLAEFRTESGTTVTLRYFKDRLGSTAAMLDGSWNVLEEYRYSAFGSPYRKTGDGTWEALGAETETLSGTVRPEPMTDRLYTGREWDSETRLHYYRARTYSPELWRFLQRDPVGTADQVNPYAYVRNNPLAFTDPTGAVCLEALWKVMLPGLEAVGTIMYDRTEDMLRYMSDRMVDTGLDMTINTGEIIEKVGTKWAPVIIIWGCIVSSWWMILATEWYWVFGISSACVARSAAWTAVALAMNGGWKIMKSAWKAGKEGWTNHWFKHTPWKNAKWEDVVESTKNGPAKYKREVNIENIEKDAWKNWENVTTGKPWKVKEFDEVIGAKWGKESRWMRVESSAWVIHGHPITEGEYINLLK